VTVDIAADKIQHLKVYNLTKCNCFIKAVFSCLKNKVIYIDRDEADLDEDEYFLTDLIGFTAVSAADGVTLGKVTDILTLPGGDICEIKGQREILVPLRPEFIVGRDMEAGILTVSLIEGM
jgi:16S rRNA processing protein RimM